MSGPLVQVKEAVDSGITTVDGICRRTGLSALTVDAILAHLTRTGGATRVNETMACNGVCAGCKLADGCHTPRNGITILRLGARGR